MPGFPVLDVGDFQQEIRIVSRFRTEIQHDGGPNEPLHRNFGHVKAVFAGHPVNGGVEVGANMLAGVDVVVAPKWARLVVRTYLLEAEVDEVRKRRRKAQCGRAAAQWGREINDFNVSAHHCLQGLSQPSGTCRRHENRLLSHQFLTIVTELPRGDLDHSTQRHPPRQWAPHFLGGMVLPPPPSWLLVAWLHAVWRRSWGVGAARLAAAHLPEQLGEG